MSFLLRARFLMPALATGLFMPFNVAHAQTVTTPTTAKNGSRLESSSFTLRWIKPSQFFDSFDSLPPGLLRVSPDDTTHRLFVQGTPEALNGIPQIIRLLDVEPRRIRLTVRILRAPALYDFASVPAGVRVDLGEPGTKLPKSEVITTAAAVCRNNETITLQAIGEGQRFHVQVTPHVNGDESVSVSADFSEVPNVPYIYLPPSKSGEETAKEAQKEKHGWTKRVGNGVAVLLDIMPSRKDKGTAYYLEVTPLADEKPER